MKNQFFNPLQTKHLMAHKSRYLKAIATEEGLRLCPDIAQNVVHVLDPIPVKMEPSVYKADNGRNRTYYIEEGYQIAKLADALDFSKAEVVEENDTLYFVIGKKQFRMVDLCVSESWRDMNLENYTGTVEWNDVASKAIQLCNIAAYKGGTERYFLQGVFIDPQDDTIVATDGYRMIYRKSNFITSGTNEFHKAHLADREDNDLIIPTWIVPYLDGYCKMSYAWHDKESEDTACHSVHAVWTYWKLETGGEIYLFSPIDGKFPKWRKVVPEFLDNHYEYIKDTFDFEGMKRYKKAGTHDHMRCRFFESTCTQMYNGEIELDISVKFPGLKDGVDMYCNAQFLIDGAKLFGKEAEVNVSLPEPEEGHIVKGVDIASVDGLLHYVIMPMQP